VFGQPARSSQVDTDRRAGIMREESDEGTYA
jgi:hypothetical protein